MKTIPNYILNILKPIIISFQVIKGNRSQRFLFDAIFGLEVPVFEEQSVEEDDDDTKVKNCSCGKCIIFFHHQYLTISGTVLLTTGYQPALEEFLY